MHRRPLRTYGKNPNSNRPTSATIKLIDYRHNVFDSSDSDDNILEVNGKNDSTKDYPFESTFDRIAKTARLPPMPTDNNPDNSILYISSSSSSSFSDENWIRNIEKNAENPPKKTTIKKRRKKMDRDKTNNIDKIPVRKTQIANRKRQNNLHDVNNQTKNNEVSPPERKTKRSLQERATLEINGIPIESDINASPATVSPSVNKLNPCCVELTRVKITEHRPESNDKSHLSFIDNGHINYDNVSTINNETTPIPLVSQHDNKFTDMRNCHIVLSRLHVDTIVPSKNFSTPNSEMISSTPFVHRILPSNLKPSFSPINNKFHDTIDVSSTTEVDELNEIRNTNDVETHSTRLRDSSIDNPSTEQSMNFGSIKVHSQSDIDSSRGCKIDLHLVDDEKSTKLLFDTDDAIDDTDYNTKDIPNESYSRENSMDMQKVSKIGMNSLSLSPDDNRSRSMFDDTKLETNNVSDDSHRKTSHRKSSDNTFEYGKSLMNEKVIPDKIESDSMISEIGSLESNASIASQTLDTIYTVASSNNFKCSNGSTRASNKDTSEDSYQLLISNSSSNENSLEKKSMDVTNSKICDSNSSGLNVTVDDNELIHSHTSEPIVLLTRLMDPVKVTKKRGKYVNWDRQLVTITESLEKRASITIPRLRSASVSRSIDDKQNSSTEASSSANNVVPRLSRRTRSSVQHEYRQIGHDESHNNDEIKMVFLKPGKSWARSLSILNHINKNDDIEMLSIGKGKKWRQSVKNVLDMQSQGVLQSCVKNGENENDERAVSYGIRRSDVTRISSSTITGTVESTSPGRFVRRVSIRVVPDNKYSKIEGKDMRDTSFLEVYGIPTSKNRKTSENRSTSIARRETSVYNLRCSNVNIAAVAPDPVVAARDVVLQRCNQTSCVSFEECYPETFLERCRKIGEGVYGEVFLFENKKEKSVIKIIPIEGEKLVNGEPQKKFCEILSEIIIAKELHNLRFHNVYNTSGFVEVKKIRCLKGKYPQKLIEHWQTYDEEKTSDNDCPSMFSDDQLYIALELGHGGNDLEAFVFQNANEAYTSFVQAALTLAVAEKSLDFEHRDLHWGNILISRTNDTEMFYKLDTDEITFPCRGLKVAIIDFTLSRMSYQGCCMFNDLALDPALFTAAGEYQFEIYRLMKAKVGNDWQLFEPYTNILWLHYTLDKMITSVRYRKITTKIHKNAIFKLQELKNEVLNYDSAYDFITNCDKLMGLQRRSSSS